MTQRPTAPTERARACPFVAFEDDRDMRSDRPDHRHRCYAEKRPAPRAIAHQEAFCLSSAFPACPTFQDWARREAAQARGGGGAAAAAGSMGAMPLGAGITPSSGAPDTDDAPALTDGPRFDAPPPDDDDVRPDEDGGDDDGSDDDGRDDDRDEEPGYEPPAPGWQPDDMPTRNASRGWAAPPPWIAGPADRPSTRGADAADSGIPSRSSGSGTDEGAPRPAGGLASSRWLADVEPGDELDGDVEAAPVWQRPSTPRSSTPGSGTAAPGTPAFLAGRAAAGAASSEGDAEPDRDLASLVGRNRPAGSPTRKDPRPMAGQGRSMARDQRSMAAQQRAGRRQPPRTDEGPSWERPRRFEAYPTLKTRVGMPAVPRIAVAALAILVAAVALVMLPALFISKNDPGSSATPASSIAPSISVAPTTPPAPTPVTYTIKKGDTISKIAKSFGLTTQQLLDANPQIKDPNKIKIGDVITIPTAVPSEIIDSTSPSPSDSGSSAP